MNDYYSIMQQNVIAKISLRKKKKLKMKIIFSYLQKIYCINIMIKHEKLLEETREHQHIIANCFTCAFYLSFI